MPRGARGSIEDVRVCKEPETDGVLHLDSGRLHLAISFTILTFLQPPTAADSTRTAP